MTFAKVEDPYFRSLLNHLPDAIYFKDLDSKFTLCNQAQARNLNAASVDALIGKTDADFLGPLHSVKAREDELTIMRDRVSMDNQLEKVDFADGSIVWYSTSKAPIIDDDDNVVGVMGITRDVTKEKELQDALKEAHQTISETSRKAGRSEVASIVIHNVGNILNSVNVTATMIDELFRHYESLELNKLAASIRTQLETPSLDPSDFLSKVAHYIELAGQRYQESCDSFKEEVERLQRDVSNIQRIIMLQQDMASFWKKVQFRSCDSIVEDVLEINRIAMQRHGVRCETDLSATTEWLIPEFQTLQILLNFLSNGKYAFDGMGIQNPLIKISSGVDADKLFISVKDNGPGIAEETLDKIFELGFTTREGGHGIGLHSSLMTAHEVEGSVEAFSEGIGKGAEFVFSLPLSKCRRNE